MNILWVTNILMPEATTKISGTLVGKGSGGWLSVLANALARQSDIELSIVTASLRVKKLTIVKGEFITYYVMPIKGVTFSSPYFGFIKEVSRQAKPNLVHIHGTEFPYGRAYIELFGSERVVVSMQGVMKEISDHYIDGLSKWQIARNITFRDLRLKTIFGEMVENKKRVANETFVLKKLQYAIGRTSFDKNYVMSVNPAIKYYVCNESLRDEFYNNRWAYTKCNPHTIFLSQSNYPLKGLHQILRALPTIKERFPDVKVRIAGTDITKHHTMKEIVKYGGYGKIINELINKYNLKEDVCFTGLLNAKEMVDELLSCNIFICPSAVENSSNSIAEAQIVGVPCLASNRGGNPDMIGHYGELFEFDDVEELASKVCDIFDSSKSFDNSEVIAMARKRHDRDENLQKTLEIYNEIDKRYLT